VNFVLNLNLVVRDPLAGASCWKEMKTTAERFFTPDDPIAFFITWTCYGTWLPGDQRGWHQWGKAGVQPPSELIESAASAKMKEPEFLLSKEDREVVQTTIKAHCRIRGWTLHKVNARSNHVPTTFMLLSRQRDMHQKQSAISSRHGVRES